MRFFKKEEAPKRVEIAGMCHKLMKSLIEKFGEERKIYSSNWVEMFNQGKIEDIETFHKQAKEVVKEQADTVTKLMKMIEEQEKEIEESHDPHLRYSRLVSSFFGKGIDPYKKSKEEVIEILKLLKNLRDVLNMQKQELESEEGPGQEAYGQKRFQELLRQEYQLLKEVQPFWHDWEVLADRLLKVLDPRNEIDEDEWKRVVSDIESYLKQYHAEYSDNGRAAQIGTELAINLFLNSKMKNIPVTIVNIDMTHCNNLDKSHKLGNEMVRLGYEKLSKRLRKDFPSKQGGTIDGKGVVTILGRTRYKIVGVPFKKVQKALKKVPEKILPELKKRAEEIFSADDYKEKVDMIKTSMYGGYEDKVVNEDIRKDFHALINLRATHSEKNQGESYQDIDKQVGQKLRKIEERVAQEVGQAFKQAAARAEYLEKEIVSEQRKELEQEFLKRLQGEGIPISPSLPHEEDAFQKLEKKVWGNFRPQVLYKGDVTEEYQGTNYIPEEQFKQRMVQRISHQLGFDLKNFKDLKEMVKDAVSGQADKEELRKMRDRFIQQTLQKRARETAYDLRFYDVEIEGAKIPAQALREGAFDNSLTKAMFVEGPQVWTFFEIDGFNAFNKVYKPDGQDTYYHKLLEDIFRTFDETINSKRKEDEKILPRMTKQGDEIWLSYPLNPKGGQVKKKDHERFLGQIQERIWSREESLEIENQRTTEWIPHLILDDKATKAHIDNALLNGREIYYVDNERLEDNFKEARNMKAGDWVQITDLNKSSFLPGADLIGKSIKANKEEEKFHKWKSIYNCRQVNGKEFFDVKTFKYPLMLFPELMKRKTKQGSERFRTGRVIRLGYTIGYTGYEKPHFRPKTPEELKKFREALNKRVEGLREEYERGVMKEVKVKLSAQ